MLKELRPVVAFVNLIWTFPADDPGRQRMPLCLRGRDHVEANVVDVDGSSNTLGKFGVCKVPAD